VNGCFWSDCTGTTPENGGHSECQDQACVCVEGEGSDECSTDDDCITENQPVVYNLSSTAGSYCTGIQGVGIAYFQWYYLDPQSKTQYQYEIQIDDNSDFSSPEVDRIAYYTGTPSGSQQQQLVLVKQVATTPGCDYINYSTTYYWRVKVKNSAKVDSGWIYYNGGYGVSVQESQTSYTYEYAHPSPVPAYSYAPSAPAPTTLVNFTDSSICYDNTSLISCADLTDCLGGNCYTWSLGDSGSNSDPATNPPVVYYTEGNIPASIAHTYTQAATFGTSLKVCDDIGCCTAAKNINVQSTTGKDLPSWKEVSPF